MENVQNAQSVIRGASSASQLTEAVFFRNHATSGNSTNQVLCRRVGRQDAG